MLNVGDLILELDNGATISVGLVRWLGQFLHVAKERGMLREDTPVDAELRVSSLQHDASILIPDIGTRYGLVLVGSLAFGWRRFGGHGS